MNGSLVSFTAAVEDKTVAHRWCNRYFCIVPGPTPLNFRVRPDVSGRGLQFWHEGRTFTLSQALEFLVRKHGGIDEFLTEEMRQEAADCRAAASDVAAAARLLLDRYAVTEKMLGQLTFVRKGESVRHTGHATSLQSLIELSDVSALGRIHGPSLGQSLLQRVRGRGPVVWTAGRDGYRPKSRPF